MVPVMLSVILNKSFFYFMFASYRQFPWYTYQTEVVINGKPTVIEHHMMIGTETEQIFFNVRAIMWLTKGLNVGSFSI